MIGISRSQVVSHPGSRKRFGVSIVFALFLAWLLVAADRAGWLWDAPNAWTHDWLTLLFSEHAGQQRSDIAIVAITDDSLATYPYRSPVDRGLITTLVRGLDEVGAKVIALDLIFDRKTEPEKDNGLINAIRTAKTPIILGALDARSRDLRPHNLAFQKSFLEQTGRPAGHLYIASKHERLEIGDHAIRFMGRNAPGHGARDSLSMVIAKQMGARNAPASRYIDWLLPPTEANLETFAVFSVPVQAPGSAASSLIPESWRPALAGKVIIVGGNFSDRDQHLTPLSVLDKSHMPGLLIQAQIVAQLLDGRSIHVTPVWAEVFWVFLVGLAAFCLARRGRLVRNEIVGSIAVFVVFTLIGGVLFSDFKILVPSTTIFAAWGAGVITGHCSDRLYQYLGLLPT